MTPAGTEPGASIDFGVGVLAYARALDFAARRHCDQRRKGLRQEPYVNHVAEVALLVAEATGGTDLDAILAGLLHDTMEDTDTTRDELAAAFGPAVAAIVAEVTDDKALPKAERKRRQVADAPHASHAAKLVKLADKISNVRSMAFSPPAGWSHARLNEYVAWSQAVVDGLRGTNPWLEAQFDAAVVTASTAFAQR